MIAPDPVTAAPLPPAPAREVPRAMPVERRRGEDFGALLAPATAGAQAPEPAPEPAPAEEQPEAVALGTQGVPPALTLPAPPETAAPDEAAELPDDPSPPAAPGPEAALLPSVAAMPAAPAPATVTEGRVAEIGRAAAPRPAADPGQGPRPAHPPVPAGPKASEMERPVPAPAAAPQQSERSEGPTAETAPAHRAAEAKSVEKTEAVAMPAGGDAGRAPVLVESAPPAWHLRAEAPAPLRGEPALPAPTPTPAPAVTPQAVAPQAVVGQVAVAIGRASDESVELRLDPPELGRVQIHLSRHDGAVQAVVLADRPETQDLLRRHAEVLARELGEAGYDSVRLDFGGGEQARPDDPGARDWAQAVERPGASEPVAVSVGPQGTPPRVAGRLDIRL